MKGCKNLLDMEQVNTMNKKIHILITNRYEEILTNIVPTFTAKFTAKLGNNSTLAAKEQLR